MQFLLRLVHASAIFLVMATKRGCTEDTLELRFDLIPQLYMFQLNICMQSRFLIELKY